MMPWSNWKVKKWMSVLGSFLLVFPIGISFSWANLGMYALSYIAVRGRDKDGVDTPWIVSLFYMNNILGMFLSGLVKKPRTRRVVLFLSVFMVVGGVFLTYLAVQTSVTALTMTVGVFCGFTGGVLNGMAIQYAVEWADSDLGLIICLVQSGSQFCPILANPLFTLFVNPDNLSPSIEVNSIRLFSQPEILDRIPLAFIGLGAITFLLEIIGALCLRDAASKNPEEIQMALPESVPRVRKYSDQKVNDTTEVVDIDIRQMITSVSFHALSANYLLFECSIVVLVNYYKDYGAIWINDDHFLANMGVPFVICTAVGYSASGFVSDRIGVKKTLICLLSMSSWMFLAMFFTPMLNRWLYAFNVLLLGFFFGPIFSIITVATKLLFGKTNHMRNLFLVTLTGTLFDFANPPILEALLTAGWFYVLLFSSSVCALSLTIVVMALPNI